METVTKNPNAASLADHEWAQTVVTEIVDWHVKTFKLQDAAESSILDVDKIREILLREKVKWCR